MDEQRYFTTDGLLSVGYDYQNMVFAEGYNGLVHLIGPLKHSFC